MSTPISSNFHQGDSVSKTRSTDLTKLPSVGQNQSSAVIDSPSVLSNLTNINSLISSAKSSSPDIRQDKINAAKALINDPEWVSDNLDKLADKLLSVENL